ncbi:MAG: hypothetical protein ACTS6J_01145 [Burkholderiales bacterium]
MAAEKQTKPIAGEQVLLTSDNGVLTLTNYRVKYDAKGTGASKFVSISLDAVSSCGLVTRTRPILLVLAAIGAIAAFVQPESAARYGLLLIALCLAGAYFLTRSGVITVSSNGGEGIAVPAKGMSRDLILGFLEAVMDAKLQFIGKKAS